MCVHSSPYQKEGHKCCIYLSLIYYVLLYQVALAWTMTICIAVWQLHLFLVTNIKLTLILTAQWQRGGEGQKVTFIQEVRNK